MKKEYKTPEIDIYDCSTFEPITTSGVDGSGDGSDGLDGLFL